MRKPLGGVVCRPLAATARLLALAAIVAGCSSTVTTGAATAKPAATPQPAPPRPSAPPGHLARAEVDEVITKKGPAWVLQRVVPEEVFRDGKFVGWKIVSMPQEWTGIELHAGDVVTKINGVALERPEDVWTACTKVLLAADLTIAYERDGAGRELVMPIDGAPMTELPANMRDNAPPPRKPTKGPRPTVIIDGDEQASDSDS